MEVTGALRALAWPGAAALLADLLALDLDPDQAYRVAIGEATIIDLDAEVTYSSPVVLHADRPGHGTAAHVAEGASDA